MITDYTRESISAEHERMGIVPIVRSDQSRLLDITDIVLPPSAREPAIHAWPSLVPQHDTDTASSEDGCNRPLARTTRARRWQGIFCLNR